MLPAGILAVIVSLIVVGLLLYLMELIPMDAAIKQLIRVLVIVMVVLWIIYYLFGPLLVGGHPFPR